MVESAAAAVRKAAAVSAASAERSGTAVVRITQGGQPWAGREIRWNGSDLAFADDTARAGERPRETRVVDGTLYAQDEHLATVREDVGGGTLRRITKDDRPRHDPSRRRLNGLPRHGRSRRDRRRDRLQRGSDHPVFPFGFVAHDEAADSSSPLDTAVTGGADGVVRNITVTWGAGPTAWACMVAYRDLGSTPSPTAPPDARPLRDRARAAQ